MSKRISSSNNLNNQFSIYNNLLKVPPNPLSGGANHSQMLDNPLENNEIIDNQDQVVWSRPHFPSKVNNDEKIVLIFRQHLSVLTDRTGRFLAFFLLVFTGKVNCNNQNQVKSWFYFWDSLVYISFAFLVLVFGYYFMLYYMSFWAVTTSRIIEFRQCNLFGSAVKIWELRWVSKVDWKKEKVWQVLGDGGSVAVTMNPIFAKENVVFEHIIMPSELADTIGKYASFL